MITFGFGTKTSVLPSSSIIIRPQQSHGSRVHVVTQENSSIPNPPDTDGLVTSVAGVALTVATADCVPIIYHDPHAGIIGISHSGWKGLHENIIENMIVAMEALGGSAACIDAIVGPAVGACCYPIYGERKELFYKKFGSEVFDEYPKHTGLNLAKCAYLTLKHQGILESNIHHPLYCTSCQKDLFWSYRRDGTGFPHMVHFIKL